MLKQIEGSKAVAQAVACCRPEVICAYPITPQTHIVEALSVEVKKGALKAEFLNVESEFAALSALIGASTAGARTYTATASQGLLFMIEAVYNAGGLGLPLVMTVANRAIGAPINIWNDHSDAMAARDAGWIQLFAETNQEAVDLHIQAYRLAELLSVPVMVCMDGFILTHAFEGIDVPNSDAVDSFLPAFVPRQLLDPDHPETIGAMVGPEAFTEVRFLSSVRQQMALQVIPRISQEYFERIGRMNSGLLSEYELQDAQTVIVAMGSILGTIKDAVDELRQQGEKVGVVGVTCFRPFPADEMRKMLHRAQRIIVVERAVSAGSGGILASDVASALQPTGAIIQSVIAGLGGRPVTKDSLYGMVGEALRDELPALTFLDLKVDLVRSELEKYARSQWAELTPEVDYLLGKHRGFSQ